MTSQCELMRIEDAAAAGVDGARELFVEYVDSLAVDLSFQDFERELAEFPRAYLPPRGALLLASRGGAAAGCVAMRALGGDVCEMKRLYVRRTHRNLGIGRLLAEAVIDIGAATGYRRMRLDTLPGMDDAQRLYRDLGFREIEPYYANPIAGTKYMELDLGAWRTRGGQGPDAAADRVRRSPG